MSIGANDTVVREEGGVRPDELSAPGTAEARARLGDVGLQSGSVKPYSRRAGRYAGPFVSWWYEHRRASRRIERAELYDGVGTMLDAGLPIIAAMKPMMCSKGMRRSMRTMLVVLGESIKSGVPLADAMREHPAWFDATDVAAVDAGQRGGHLSTVLRSLADHHQRVEQLGHALAGALLYPLLVGVAAAGVACFLSIHTLPQLAELLAQSGVPVPRLTSVLMEVGQIAISYGWLLLVLVAVGILAFIGLVGQSRLAAQLLPISIRRQRVATLSRRLAELLRAGVPLIDAVRAVQPTVHGHLHQVMQHAGDELGRGEALDRAFDEPLWFDQAYRQMLSVAVTAGELESMLDRVADRSERTASRQLERLTSLIEPLAILVLAVITAVIVMAVVLPLIRLQEIVG